MQERDEQKQGAFIAIIIIVLLCALGAYYLYKTERAQKLHEAPDTNLSIR